MMMLYIFCHPQRERLALARLFPIGDLAGDCARYTSVMHQYSVYILASRPRGALYIGVTNNLVRRLWEHKQKQTEGFTEQYGVDVLVYVESTPDVKSAIAREKQLKKWNRDWKIKLIEEQNPYWRDLSVEYGV